MGSYYAGVINSDYDSELRHHGILGQKWGIRRFQNEDMTWTEAGKERYGRHSSGSGDSSGYSGKRLKKKSAKAAKNNAERPVVSTGITTIEKPKKFTLLPSRHSKLDGRLTDKGKEEFSKDVSKLGWEKAEKQYNNYVNTMGTKSLAFGDHSNDKGPKVLESYQKYMYEHRKELNKARRSGEDGYYKYKDKVADLSKGWHEKYAAAVLEDMGYEPNEHNIEWLSNQFWFGIGRPDWVLD